MTTFLASQDLDAVLLGFVGLTLGAFPILPPTYLPAMRQAYLARTPILLPLPPFLYRPLPPILKHTLFLDFPFYQFDERVDGSAAVEEETRRLRGQEGEDV